MRPNIAKEQRNGWIILAAVAVLSIGTVAWYSDDDGLEGRLNAARGDYAKKLGKELMQQHLDGQQKANKVLLESIDAIKKSTSFRLAPFFTITDQQRSGNRHDTDIWAFDQFGKVQSVLDERARELDLKDWDGYGCIGYPSDRKTFTDRETVFQSTMLQITYRVAMICFSVLPHSGTGPIHSITINHSAMMRAPPAIGPAGRPALLREYPIDVTVSAPIAEVIWILYRFSNPNAFPDPAHPDLDPDPNNNGLGDPGRYPLVVKHLEIDGNTTVAAEPPQPIDGELDVTAHFTVAAIEYLDDAHRIVSTTPGALGTGAAPAASPAATEVTQPGSQAGSAALAPRF